MTNKLEQAARQALDALEVHQPDPEQQMVTEAIIALQEALDHSGEVNEMVDCYQEVYDALETQLIKEPTGNGLDQVAQNNGLIIAMNTLQKIHLAEQVEQEPIMRKTTRDEKIVRPGVYEVSVEQAEQEPVVIDDEKLIKLAVEAGFEYRDSDERLIVRHSNGSWVSVGGQLADFAALITTPVQQAEQEPVAIVEVNQMGIPEITWDKFDEYAAGRYELYAAPVQQAEQEPVAWGVRNSTDDFLVFQNKSQAHHYATEWEFEVTPLYAAPVRTKDLTDDEIDMALGYPSKYRASDKERDDARAVIAADREKNK